MDARVIATLPASDIARAKNWYRDHLDLKATVELPDGSAFLESGGTRFLLYQSSFAGTNQATAASFEVDDFDAAIAGLRSRGVVFEEYDFDEEFRTVDGVITLPDGTKAAWFKDSEGNILGLPQTP